MTAYEVIKKLQNLEDRLDLLVATNKNFGDLLEVVHQRLTHLEEIDSRLRKTIERLTKEGAEL